METINEIMEVDDVIRLQDEYCMQRNAVKGLINELLKTEEGNEILKKFINESDEKSKDYIDTIIYDVTFY